MINISAKVKVSQYALAKKNPSAFRTPSLVTTFHCKLWATKTFLDSQETGVADLGAQ